MAVAYLKALWHSHHTGMECQINYIVSDCVHGGGRILLCYIWKNSI